MTTLLTPKSMALYQWMVETVAKTGMPSVVVTKRRWPQIVELTEAGLIRYAAGFGNQRFTVSLVARRFKTIEELMGEE